MKWLLVVIVMNSPVKTDLVFDTLRACLAAETEMRQHWADLYNEVIRNKSSKDTIDMVRGQMTHGTCIPTK